jgi:hypothetical protein
MKSHNNSDCCSLLGYLSDYIDGNLSIELCEEINHHITECQNCHIVVDTLHKTLSIFHTNEAVIGELPGKVRERLFRSLDLGEFILR